MLRTNVALSPKVPGGPLRVLVVGRISTDQQPLENIEASYRYVENYLKRLYPGKVYYKHFGERASGMKTDRATIRAAEEEIATGTWDLVITEDLSRLYRNPRYQYSFVQDAVDNDTRVICIADDLDTADDHWETAMGTAALRHGMHIPDTRRRVKRTAEHSFHNGGMVMKVRFGYRKLTAAEAATGEHGPKGLRVARVAECTPLIREMARRVIGGVTYAAVARWLNEEGVKLGAYVSVINWNGRLVRSLLGDPILRGTRTFGAYLGKIKYKTGRAKRRKNPDSPQTTHHEELAHLSVDEHRELARVMGERAAENANATGADHPRFDRPRSQSIWPGQHPRCAACGALMYRCEKDQLKCRGSFRSTQGPPCWNHVLVRSQEVRDRVLPRLLEHCEQFPKFRGWLADAAWEGLQGRQQGQQHANRLDEEEIADLEKQAAKLAQAIGLGEGGPPEALLQRLTLVECSLKAARCRKAERALAMAPPRWRSRQEMESQLGLALFEMAKTSYEFGDLMRQVIPEFVIVPVQALDSGLVRPRANLTFGLSAFADDPAGATADDVTITVDLFEPPVHVRAIPDCVEAKRINPRSTLDEIAALTGYHRMTVKRALRYSLLMAAEGLEGPYRELTEQPASASRWKHGKVS